MKITNRIVYTKTCQLLAIASLIACAALSLTKLLLESQSALYKNEFWVPYKSNFYGLSGQGIESLVAREKIAGDKLRTLHNRIFSRDKIEPTAIAFKAALHSNGFVDILFNADETSYEGVRLTTKKGHNPYHYRALHSGKYLWKREISFRAWSYDVLFGKLERSGQKLKLSLNMQIFELETTFSKGQVGFDVSDTSILWDPVITTRDGNIISVGFLENAFNQTIFIKHFLLVLVVVILWGLIHRKKLLKACQGGATFIALTTVLLYVFDSFYYSRQGFRYSHREFTFIDRYGDLPWDTERIRFNFHKKWFTTLGGNPRYRKLALPERQIGRGARRVRYCDENDCRNYASESYPELSEKK